MKKIIILCVLMMSILTSVCFANTPPENYFWVASNSEETWYIDKETIKYTPENDTCEFWAMIIEPSKDIRLLQHMKVVYNTRNIILHEYIVYKNDNPNPIEHSVLNPPEKATIAPSTIGNMVAKRSAELIDRDNKLAEYKKQQAEEAEENEKADKDKKRKAQQKEATNTAIGILGGLIR